MARTVQQIQSDISLIQSDMQDGSISSDDGNAQIAKLNAELAQVQAAASQPDATQPDATQPDATQPQQPQMPVVPQLPNRPNPTGLPPMGPRYPSPKSFANEDAKKLYDWAIGREMARDVKTPEEAAYIQEVKKTLGMPTFSYKPDFTKFTQAELPSDGTEPVRRPGVTAPEFTLDQLKEGQPADTTQPPAQGQPGDSTQPADQTQVPEAQYYTPEGDELEAIQYQDFLYPSLPPDAIVDFNEIEVDEDQFLTDPEDLQQLDARYQVADAAGLDVTAPVKPDAASYSAALVEGTPEYEAAKGTVSANSLVGDIQGAVSEEAIAQAQTEELDERATVQYQMEKLFESFEEGKPPPAWAAPAMRAAGAAMAQRGLGRSSMAAAAITQAALESGIQISVQDANKYAAIQITNLNNKQQAALQNAMTYAAMDRANLDARMTAAVNNSRAFLSMDLENVKNEQQLKTIDLQNSYQTLFNNQAAENAALQFNAKSQAQVDQFFAELDVQVQNANSNRLAAMKQFNTDQVNSAFRYYDKINDERERFNVNMQVQIDQSNAVWRRELNTRNTAIQNEENRINAANLLNISVSAQNRLWQKARDEAQWAMQQTENALQRAHQVAMFAQETEFKKEMYEEDFDNSVATSIGAAGFDIVKKILTPKQA